MKSVVCSALLGVILVHTHAEVLHRFVELNACQSNFTKTEFNIELDGDAVFYVDVAGKIIKKTLPDFADPFDVGPLWVLVAVSNIQICFHDLATVTRAEGYPPEAKDPPDVMVYPRNMLELGTPNTLICAVKNFHPMDVNVTWTKNNHLVSEGVRQTELLPNEDFTFNLFSFLTFTPELGDIYSCQVAHSALPQVLTRLWEVDIKTKSSYVGATVFCGAGLTFGLLGVAVGTFLLIKGNNCE